MLYLGANLPQPDRSVLDLGHGSVLNDDLARAGGSALADLLNGIDTSRAVDPHLTTAGHHHQLEAPWDGIADSGYFGADPSGLDGMRHLSTEGHDAPDLTGVRGHTSYLADGSTSQHNLAAVGAARPDLLIDATGEPGEIDQLREEWRRIKELLGVAG